MLNPHKLPAIRVLLPFVGGILTAFHLDLGWMLPTWFLAICLAAFTATALTESIFKTELLAKISAFLIFLSVGYLACWLKQELHQPDHFSNRPDYRKSHLICRVSDAPQFKDDWVKASAKVTLLIADDSTSVQASGNILLYLERDTAAGQIAYGDLILLQKPPQRVRENTNPDAFDYSKYLHYQNIHFQSFVRSGEWHLLESGAGNPILEFSHSSQKHLVEVLRKHLHTPEEFAVGSALMLGYRDEIPQTVKEAYAQTGAMHVLAVSGLHVGIIFIILTFLLARIRIKSKLFLFAKTSLIVLGIWVFALLTGAAPSVMRAATMFSLLAIGQGLGRSGAIYNTLMVSALVLLLINPLWLASVGFQLSYLAVFGIVYFQRKIERMVFVPKGFLRKIWTLLTVSLAAQLTTGPVSIFYFRQFPLFFWLSSLFLVPAAALLMTGGMLLIFFDWLMPGVAFYLGKALWACIWLCNQIVFLIQSFPGALLSDLYLSGHQTILLYLAMITAMVFISHKHSRALVLSAAFGMVFLASTSFTSISNSEKFEMVVYDQYKSSIIEFYHNRQCFRICQACPAPSSLDFVVKGHHQRLGIREIFDVSGSSACAQDSLFVKTGNRMLFGGMRILRLTRAQDLYPASNVEVDVLIVSENAISQLQKTLSKVKCRWVVFDSSNSLYTVENCVHILDSLELEYFSVPKQGAFQKQWQIE